MSGLEEFRPAETPELLNFRLVASGSFEQARAAEIQQRVIAALSAFDGLLFSVTIGRGEPIDAEAETESQLGDKEALRQWLNSEIARPLEEADVSARARHCLRREEIKTYRDLLLWGEAGLSDIRNFGAKSLTEVENFIRDNPFGMKLEREPSLAYAASICDDVSQLPIHFAKISFPSYRKPNMPLPDFAAMSAEEIAEKYLINHYAKYDYDLQKWVEPDPEEEKEFYVQAREMKQQAVNCIQEFARLKAEQAGQ